MRHKSNGTTIIEAKVTGAQEGEGVLHYTNAVINIYIYIYVD